MSWCLLACFALAFILLHRLRFGQHLYAVGGNREAARYTGIGVVRIEAAAYLWCGLFAGIAGVLVAAQLSSIEAKVGEGYELNAIAAAAVGGVSLSGGVGTIGGTLLGAAVIGVLNKGLNQADVHFSWQYVLKGVVILAAVYFDSRRRRNR
jgi:ribose transport system permease protein